MGLDAAAPLTENAAWKELEVHYRQSKDIHLRRLFAEDPAGPSALLWKTSGSPSITRKIA